MSTGKIEKYVLRERTKDVCGGDARPVTAARRPARSPGTRASGS